MRLFVAIDITDKGTQTALSELQRKLQIDAKPVQSQNLHFTMMFLGEVSESQRRVIQDSLKEVKFEPFEIKLCGVGAFPSLKHPRIIWVGTDRDGGDRLVKLAKLVEKALLPLGFTSDKPFKPHITIFRIKKRIGNLSHLSEYQSEVFGSQFITEIKLKQSILTSTGPNYTDLFIVKSDDQAELS